MFNDTLDKPYPSENACQIAPSGPIDNLRTQKANLEGRLKTINEALDALEKNPQLAEVLQLVGRALR